MAATQPDNEPPIQNIDQVDIVGQREDGGIDLFIIASSALTPAAEHQELLLSKIESYLQQLNSAEFKAEFNNPRPDQVRIVLASDHPLDPVILQLIENAKPWVEANHARLSVHSAE